MILAYTFFAMVGLSQSSAFPIARTDYHTRAKLLPKVLAEISEKTGENLKCGMTLANEVVIMEVKDAPLSDLMPQLAEAVCGKWTKSQDEWILSLDASRYRQEERAEIAARKPLFEKALKPYIETLDEPFDGKDADALIARMKANQPGADGGFSRAQIESLIESGARSPGGRAIGRVLRSVDLSRLAAMQLGDRIVFSTHPTAAQIPLGASARNLIPDLVKEQAIWSSARAGFPSKGARVGLLSIGDVYDQNPIVETPSKAILVVEQAPGYGSTSADFQLANREGKVIYRCRAEMTVETPAGTNAPDIPKTLRWSDRTEHLFAQLRKHSNPAMMFMEPRVSEEFEKDLIRCEENDPNATFTSDLFFAVGRSSATNWIGVPDDEYWYWNLSAGLRSNDELPKKLYWYDELKSTRNGESWSVLRPRFPAKSFRQRVNRKQLSLLLAAVRETRVLSLNALADYVFNTGHTLSTMGLENFYVNLVSREPNFGQRTQLSAATLGFYGSLSARQRAHLQDGGSIGISQLTPTQTEWAWKTFFEASPNISMQPLSKLGYDGAINAHYLLGSTLRLEPTEVLSLGKLPGNGQISMSDTSQEELQAVIEGEIKSYKTSTPYYLGQMIGQHTASKQLNGSISGFRMGARRQIRIQIDATNALQVLCHLSERQFDYRQPLRPLSELPEKVQTEYEKGIAKGLVEGARFVVPEPRKSPPPR